MVMGRPATAPHAVPRPNTASGAMPSRPTTSQWARTSGGMGGLGGGGIGSSSPRGTVPLATVLAMLSDVENVTASAEALAACRRARSHALTQERQFGGVQLELFSAVESLHRGLMTGSEPPGGAPQAAQPPQTARPYLASASPRASAMASARAGSASARSPRRLGGHVGGARGPSVLKAMVAKGAAAAAPAGGAADAGGGSGGGAVFNPLVQLAMRRELKEIAGGKQTEQTFLGGGSVTKDQISKIAKWKEDATEKDKAVLR